MKNTAKRFVSFSMVLIMLSVLTVSAFAEKVTYSDTQNTGIRDEICVSLEGTGAVAYYSGDNSYEKLSSLTDIELLAALRNLMTVTHTYKSTYAESRDLATKTDCEGGDGKIVLLYTSSKVEFSDFIGSGSIGWNREHVWAKSLGGLSNEGAGADLHHVRPDDVTTNAKRGNLKFGNAAGGSEVKGSTLVSGALGGYASGGYFEPLDNVKGDVARICLYVYARYGGELSKCSSITNVFESVDVLLEWCESDPVDTWEMGRNEVVGKIQGNRNVFIDYPEYAWLLFGREIPENMTTPSGMALKKEETTVEETTAEITASVTEIETTAEITSETTEEITEPVESAFEVSSDPATDTQPAEEKGCGGFSSCAIFVLIPIFFAVLKKKKK
ncbi:MAG: endonuclease [Clostridia bacterium]|nr:endonuclease [Clostridia bacterium]